MRMSKRKAQLRCTVIALFALSFAQAAQAQAPTSSKETPKTLDFKGKTVTILVGTSPGGGWDTEARSTALTLQKILPGNPRVVVQNIPGGDGDRALRRMGDAQTPRDGTVIMPVHGRFFVDAILGKPHPFYDPEKQFVGALRSRQTGHLLWAWREVATSWDQIMAMPCCLTLAAGERFGWRSWRVGTVPRDNVGRSDQNHLGLCAWQPGQSGSVCPPGNQIARRLDHRAAFSGVDQAARDCSRPLVGRACAL